MTDNVQASSWKPGWDDLGLVLLTIAGLGLVCANGFIYLDDPAYIFANPMVQGGLSLAGVRWAFTDISLGMWLPFTWLSLQLDSSLFGPGPSTFDIFEWSRHAWGFHQTNLILHALNVVLLYRLLRGATGAKGCSFLTAALWAIHPLRVESVSWITERKDVLSGLFFLLTLLAYGRYVRAPSWGKYLVMLFCFVGGLGSKPIVVTLPFVLLLWDYWPLGRLAWGQPVPAGGPPAVPLKRAVLEKLPLFALSFFVSFVTFRSHHGVGSLGSTTLLEHLPLAIVSYGWHLFTTFWPLKLGLLYPIRLYGFGDWRVLTSLGVLLSVTFLLFWKRRSVPYALVGWLWFLGVLLPVSGISQAGSANMNDRFTYLPHIGLLMALVWLTAAVFDRAKVDGTSRAIVASVVLGSLFYLTVIQVRQWEDTWTLLRHTIAVTERNALVYRPLAGYFDHIGKLDLAEQFALDALRNTHDEGFHVLLAIIYGKQERNDEALKHLHEADDFDRRDPMSTMMMAEAYTQIGSYQDAIRHCERALRFQAGDVNAMILMAKAYYQLGDYAMVDQIAARAERIAPNNPHVRRLLMELSPKQ